MIAKNYDFKGFDIYIKVILKYTENNFMIHLQTTTKNQDFVIENNKKMLR